MTELTISQRAEVASMLDKLPNEEMCNRLREGWKSVQDTLRLLEPEMVRKPNKVYIATKLWDRETELMHEIRLMAQINDTSVETVEAAFNELNETNTQHFVNFVASIRSILTVAVPNIDERREYERKLADSAKNYVMTTNTSTAQRVQALKKELGC